MGERAIDVLQQSVQRVSDDSDLVVWIGVIRLHPGGDAMIVTGERRARDLGGGDGDPAQRPQRVPDHQGGKSRRHQQRGYRKHCRTDDSAADGLVDQTQRNPNDEYIIGAGFWLLTRYEPRLPSFNVRSCRRASAVP